MAIELPESGFYVDSQIADEIALRSLRWHYAAILSDLEEFETCGKGHPEDFHRNIALKTYFGKVLEYYGD